MIFPFHPRIHFYIHFSNQNSRKKIPGSYAKNLNTSILYYNIHFDIIKKLIFTLFQYEKLMNFYLVPVSAILNIISGKIDKRSKNSQILTVFKY